MSKTNGQMSRRGFVAGAGVLAAMGLAGCAPVQNEPGSAPEFAESATGFPEFDIPGRISQSEIDRSDIVAEPITAHDEEETHEIVIVGAGVSGVPCAVAAYEAGADVCVLQKETSPVGQGNTCAYVDGANSDAAGLAGLLHSLRGWCSYRSTIEQNWVWANNSEEAVTWFLEKFKEAGGVEGKDFTPFPTTKFDVTEGNATVNVMSFPGTMNAPTSMVGEHFAEQINLRTQCPGVQLIQEDGRVVGVYGKKPDGTIVRFNATKAVILATGDYQNNEAMVSKYIPAAMPFQRKQTHKTGDGHLMGLLVGAKMQDTHTKMIHCKSWNGTSDVLKNNTTLAVNLEGERFCAEDMHFCYRCNMVAKQPENAWIAIVDANYATQLSAQGEKAPAEGALAEGLEDTGIFKADTLEELAEKVGMPADALKKTVERYNELAAKGADEDFGKPAKYLHPVDTAPFFAVRSEYALSAITSGLEINPDAQVLDHDGQAIEGLYAIGNCSGPFYGSIDYPMDIGGLSVSRCVTYGYVTGRKIAAL